MAEKVAEELVPLGSNAAPAAVSAWQELAGTLRSQELQSTGRLANMPRCAIDSVAESVKVRHGDYIVLLPSTRGMPFVE
eukprot:1409808-Pleurochrysis_carterae.AAC.2